MINGNNAQPSTLGTSLELGDGDLSFASWEETVNGLPTPYRDLAMIEGESNLLQGLQVMIETPYSTDIFNIRYGFDTLNILSQPSSVMVMKELIRLNIVKSLSYDNRVREIKEIVFNDEARYFTLLGEKDAETLAQESKRESRKKRKWKAAVIVQTVSEGEVVLSLEGAGQ